VTKKYSLASFGLKAPSSGRAKIIALTASLAASSCTSVSELTFPSETHSPCREPDRKVDSLFCARLFERNT